MPGAVDCLKVAAFGTTSATEDLKPLVIERRSVGDNDVALDVLYCGVCHSDLHQARNDWGGAIYPMVPGHEIVGRVSKVGSKVSKFKAGDVVGIGCMVGSCRTCTSCKDNQEQYCEDGATWTYSSNDKIYGGATYGGYSTYIVCNEDFVVRIPSNLDPAKAAPLLCAGITTYSPLRHWKVGPGQDVAIVGMGGLGHMAIKLAKAMGATVTTVTSTEAKAKEAIAMGSHKVVISSDPAKLAQCAGQFDFILSTIPVEHDTTPYIMMLKRDATLCLVGSISPIKAHCSQLIFGRRRLAGSLIGGVKETQEMLDFCAEKNILPETEMIAMTDINKCYTRMQKSDVRYRFVIDMKTMPA